MRPGGCAACRCAPGGRGGEEKRHRRQGAMQSAGCAWPPCVAGDGRRPLPRPVLEHGPLASRARRLAALHSLAALRASAGPFLRPLCPLVPTGSGGPLRPGHSASDRWSLWARRGCRRGPRYAGAEAGRRGRARRALARRRPCAARGTARALRWGEEKGREGGAKMRARGGGRCGAARRPEARRAPPRQAPARPGRRRRTSRGYNLSPPPLRGRAAPCRAARPLRPARYAPLRPRRPSAGRMPRRPCTRRPRPRSRRQTAAGSGTACPRP